MRLIALVATTALAAVVLLSCGGSDPAPTAAPAQPEATQQAQAADAPEDSAVSVTPRVYFIHTEW
ncbi:MAG: hypothetical protein OXS47_00745 [Chloroflexota bacterium]|nr:hypothetical protein [Chloroflexota bacterium]